MSYISGSSFTTAFTFSVVSLPVCLLPAADAMFGLLFVKVATGRVKGEGAVEVC